MNISNEITSKIKDSLNIHDVISEYIDLKKKGVNYVGCCPFHDEKTPSFVVSPTRGSYKCFGCGVGGDAIKFVQEHEQISFIETIKLLAKKANVELPNIEMTDEERKRSHERESMLITNTNTWNLFRANLLKNTEAMSYVVGRGYNQDMINAFGIGFAENNNQLTSHFAGSVRDTARKLNIIKKGDKGEYDAFRNRVMFPMQDVSGNIIGFAGRHIAWEKGAAFGKWLNSDESPLFSKEKVVFGLFQAKKHIAKHDKAILVEGQGDVVSLHQFGMPNTVAGSGTAFSAHQAKLIMRFTQNITLMYDGDDAGKKATLSAAEVLITAGANVRIVMLPDGEDPDSFAPKFFDAKTLKAKLEEMEMNIVEYFHKSFDISDIYKKNEVVKELARILSLMHDELLQADFIKLACILFGVGASEFKKLFATDKKQPTPQSWSPGFHGIDEARALVGKNNPVMLTFTESIFLENYDSKAYVLCKTPIEKHNFQYLLSKIAEVHVLNKDLKFIRIDDSFDESVELTVLKNIFLQGGVEILIQQEIDDMKTERYEMCGFVDFYVRSYRNIIAVGGISETVKAKVIKRCAEVIANADNSVQVVMMKHYAKMLDINQGDLKKLVQPFVNLNKDKSTIENQNLNEENDLIEFDPERLPSYVNGDKEMQQTYQLDHYYPLLKKTDKGPVPVGYMFQNEKGGGHKCVSDFYMVPLLHIEHNDSALNKRVIQLNHRRFAPRYVEWQSSFMANLGKLNEKFIEVGAYNFDGSLNQYKAIWRNMSYKFTKCTELRTFGQQPEEFWAFTNAIFHEVSGEMKVEYTNNLGVATHAGKNYYSPAFSEIFAHQRNDDDQYELDRFFVYKQAPENMKMNFEQWASLMNKVYWINDNGKWGVLFTVLACFRDYIFQHVHRFTTLFFIGPTGSGKSQVAESMRSLFMPPTAPKFNLNNGTDAAFFMLLERNKNVIAIMEEYNDTSISVLKFQGLKAAVLDGQGRQKIKDAASKTMDSSKINAVPLPLGQEAPQQDDGSLSNRVILCDVPYNPKGAFSEEEKQLFRKLKMHEESGLCDVLLEVLSIRPLIKEHFIQIYNEEIKKIQDTIRLGVSNDEGLGRVIESVAMVSAICRFLESHTELKLPFTYKEFFAIACDKVLKQMETISSSNKLQTYFSTISFLINQESLNIGKELKVQEPGKITVLKQGKVTETVELEPKDTKVLYLDFEAIYPLYHRSVSKEALSRASLRAYFESNKAYLGLCKSTNFIWYDKKAVPEKDADGKLTDKVTIVMEKRKNCTSAYMFNYDVLKELMNVDYERIEEKEEVKQDASEQDLPF